MLGVCSQGAALEEADPRISIYICYFTLQKGVVRRMLEVFPSDAGI